MKKKRLIQIAYLLITCIIGVIGTLLSVGAFSRRFKWDFYVYFTNLSNYFCLIILFIELIKALINKNNEFVSPTPKLKFIGMMSIILTFVVFNFILGPGRSLKENLKFESLSFHVIMPILFVGDYFIFYDKQKMKLSYPILGLVFPAGYLVFIIIHAAILNFDTSILSLNGYSPLIYPYFFINFEQNGPIGVLKYAILIVCAMLVVGYLFYGIDKISFNKKGDRSMAKVIMLIGIPGSGKTTYSVVLSEEYNAKVISSDKVRQTYVGIDEKEVFPMVYKLSIEELKEGRNVILDATHITPKVRKRSFDALDEYGIPYEKIAIYIDTPVEVCLKRVEKRNQDPNELFLPLEVIESYGKNIIPPTKEEGFEEIRIIKEQYIK